MFFQQRDEVALAMRCYRTAARIASGYARALALYNVGAMHLRADEVPQAHSAYLAARSAKPELAIAWDGLGAIALRRGDIKAARTSTHLMIYRKLVQPERK